MKLVSILVRVWLVAVLLGSPLMALAQSGGDIVVSKEFNKGGIKRATFSWSEVIRVVITVTNNAGEPKTIVVKDEVPEGSPNIFNCSPACPSINRTSVPILVTFAASTVGAGNTIAVTYNFTLPPAPSTTGGFYPGQVATSKNRVWGTKVRVEEGGSLVASFEAPIMVRADIPGITAPTTGRDTLWELATRLIKDGKLKARGGASLLRWGLGWQQGQYGRSRGGEALNTYTRVKSGVALLGQALTFLLNNPSFFIFGNVFAYSTAGGRIDFGNQGVVSGTGVYGAPTQKFAIPNYSIDENSAIYWNRDEAGPEKNKQINENLGALEALAKPLCGTSVNAYCGFTGIIFNLNPPEGDSPYSSWENNSARPEGGIWKARKLTIMGNVTFVNKGLIILEGEEPPGNTLTIDSGSPLSPLTISQVGEGKSLGVIIKKGNLFIGNVSKVVGAYFVPGKQGGTDGKVIFGANSSGVFVKGSLIAKDFEFNPRSSKVTEATAEGTGLTDFQGAIVYDANLIRNPPPAFANLFSAVVTPELPSG